MKKYMTLLFIVLNLADTKAQTWSALGSGMNQQVNCLTEYSNNLYAGGDFTFVNGTTTSAHYVAKWDGTTWSPLGTAVNSFVYSMVVYNGELYIGGNFTTAGGNPANYIAKWNGTSWAALGSGLNNKVYSIAVYNGELYVGGDFTTAGGNSANYIAKWNGTNWSALGAGINGATNHSVTAMAVYNSQLVVGGKFDNADGNSIANIALWDGTIFSNFLTINNQVPPTSAAQVFSIALDNNNIIYVGGSFLYACGSNANNIVRYNNSNCSSVGGGVSGATVLSGSVKSIAVYNGELYLGGLFTTGANGPVDVNYIIKFTGTNWTGLGWVALGNGVTGGITPKVNALCVFNSELYVGGSFTTAGTIAAKNIAKWSGSSVGMNESNGELSISISPNPTNSTVVINNVLNMDIEIKNTLGQTIFSKQKTENLETIDLLDVSRGIYFISIKTEKDNLVKKIIKE